MGSTGGGAYRRAGHHQLRGREQHTRGQRDGPARDPVVHHAPQSANPERCARRARDVLPCRVRGHADQAHPAWRPVDRYGRAWRGGSHGHRVHLLARLRPRARDRHQGPDARLSADAEPAAERLLPACRARLRTVRRPRRSCRGSRPDPAGVDGLGAVRHRHRGARPADLLVRVPGDAAVGADRRHLDDGAGPADGRAGRARPRRRARPGLTCWEVSSVAAWLSKWGPLAGVVSAVLIVVAFAASGTGTPGDNSTGPQVIRWYTANHGRATLGDLLVGLAMFFLVVFAAALVLHVRRGDRWIATGALGGAVVAAVGLTALLGFDLVLATDTKDLTSTSAQTLILLENDFFLPAVLGFALFGVLGGLAVVVGRILPAWMGWVLFVIGIAALVPPISWFAMLATALWVLIAGIWMVVQGPPAVEQAEPVASGERVLA